MAVLDLWATGSAWMGVVDVTVRQPCAPTYLDAAACMDGACAAEAETDKQRRYPPANGIIVTRLSALVAKAVVRAIRSYQPGATLR